MQQTTLQQTVLQQTTMQQTPAMQQTAAMQQTTERQQTVLQSIGSSPAATSFVLLLFHRTADRSPRR